MARIRTLKPEFWSDEKLSGLDVTTRLVFLGLISLADDAGRLIDNVKQIDGLLFPNTEDSSRDALDTLARLSRISRYTSASGQRLIEVVNWTKHQKVDKPSKYTLPPRTGHSSAPNLQVVAAQADHANGDDHSSESREDDAKPSRESRAPTLDLGPTTKDLRPTSNTGTSGDVPARHVREPVFGSALFEKAWEIYPARMGGNPKRPALEEWKARVAEGVPELDLLAGLNRYITFCDFEGILDTRIVMQGKTFFGPDERWKDEFYETLLKDPAPPKKIA